VFHSSRVASKHAFGSSGRTPGILHALIVLAAILSCFPTAHAQSCHMPALQSDSASPIRVAARAAFATYRTAAYAGEYQGYAASSSYSHPWFYVEAALAGYRIVRNGLAERGLGDLALDARGTVFRGDTHSFGVELALTAPTGNADLGLGMGHTMLMPGLWAAYQQEHLQLMVQVAYGRAIGSAGGHAHAATGPLVNPMNRSELEHALMLSYTFGDYLFAGGRLLGAVPVAAASGVAREVAAFGIGASVAHVQVELELQLPLVGAPFDTRSLLSVAALF
jgi:hypothetical protein